MRELIKKGFYIGVGAATLTKARLEKELKPIAKKYKLSSSHTKELAKKFLSSAKQENRKLAALVVGEVKKTAKKLGYASKPEVDKLKAKIKSLERTLHEKGRMTVSNAARRFTLKARKKSKPRKRK